MKSKFYSLTNIRIRTKTIKETISAYRAELKRKRRKSSTFPVEPILEMLRSKLPSHLEFNEEETASRIKALI